MHSCEVLAVYLRYMGEFSDMVFGIVRQIPQGKVATYGLVAQLMGRPQSSRYVGFALRNNPSPGQGDDNVPCHRVVFKDGRLCDGFAFGGPDVQRSLLEAEGVFFADDKRVDLGAYLWDGKGALPPNGGKQSAHCPQQPPDDFDWDAEIGKRSYGLPNKQK